MSYTNPKTQHITMKYTQTTQRIDLSNARGVFDGSLTGYLSEKLDQAPVFVTYASEDLAKYKKCTTKGGAPVGVVMNRQSDLSTPTAVILLGCCSKTLLVKSGGTINPGDFIICDEDGCAIALPEDHNEDVYVVGRALGAAAKGTVVPLDPYGPSFMPKKGN